MTHDRLDLAIDAVAARMTAVAEDDALAQRIAMALPERATWRNTLIGSWTLRFAVVALVAAASIAVLRTLNDRAPLVLRTEDATPVAPLVEPPSNLRRTTVEPEPNLRRTIAEPVSNHRRTDADHEFSLPSLAEVASLTVNDLDPARLPEDEALVVAPLEIADLPLTSDFPRD